MLGDRLQAGSMLCGHVHSSRMARSSEVMLCAVVPCDTSVRLASGGEGSARVPYNSAWGEGAPP